MDHPQSTSGGIDDNMGIPDELRCKRSDGKQWRCTALSMPDKTVCEKHYIQAKKRAANSTSRANMKKAKANSFGESDSYFESKSDDMDPPPLVNGGKIGDYSGSISGKRVKDKAPKSPISYSPETQSTRGFPIRNSVKLNDNEELEESQPSYRTPPSSTIDSSKTKYQKMLGSATDTTEENSESSEDTNGQPCHQCRRNDRERVIWCLKCERRGYCENCISTCYSNLSLEEIQKNCPACRGTCSCKVCLRSDNLIKVRIREIPPKEKLQYLYSLLSAVLPVVKKIHHDQCSEVELEKKLLGNQIDLVRTKLNADEQMCCDLCRLPIIDYHRHCPNCSYDLCLSCCKEIRDSSRDQIAKKLSDKFSSWRINSDGSILCPPKEYKGCGSSILTLRRIFKMNWVAKLVKNVEEMVSGCKISGPTSSVKTGFDLRLFQAAYRENEDNFLYRPSSLDIKNEGILDFRSHWGKGEPVIVKDVCDVTSMAMWDPMAIWKGVKNTIAEKTKDDNKIVKAINCFDSLEVNIELGEFIKGYTEGRKNENGLPELLKLKDWPSLNASEEFLMYQRPEFISKLPLLEFIHSKWGLLNVAAKLPHYSLQNDVGPKIYISYGSYEELGKGDSVNNLRVHMRDMVFLLVNTCEVKTEKTNQAFAKSDAMEISDNLKASLNGISDSSTEENGTRPGALWDIFRREDIPKLMEYLKVHWKEIGESIIGTRESVSHSLYSGVIYLNEHQKRRLKEELGVEAWSFEQQLGEAVFIPAGCPFQVRNLQSTVQLGLDFLSPESLGEAARLSENIRGFPNDHDAKLHIFEVGKISLYAASSAIKEVQKLVLDPKIGAELGFEDPNLIAKVSDNLEKMVKRRQITCV